jgi:hypothetical protein
MMPENAAAAARLHAALAHALLKQRKTDEAEAAAQQAVRRAGSGVAWRVPIGEVGPDRNNGYRRGRDIGSPSLAGMASPH